MSSPLHVPSWVESDGVEVWLVAGPGRGHVGELAESERIASVQATRGAVLAANADADELQLPITSAFKPPLPRDPRSWLVDRLRYVPSKGGHSTRSSHPRLPRSHTRASQEATVCANPTSTLRRRPKPVVHTAILVKAWSMVEAITFTWRGSIDDEEMVGLVQSHGGQPTSGWWIQIRQHSLGWVTARDRAGLLVGFVNVAWDGGEHAFVIDTKTRGTHQRRGIGRELVHEAALHAKMAGCEWLHVDFEPDLGRFYFGACGFRPTDAGLINLAADLPFHAKRTPGSKVPG